MSGFRSTPLDEDRLARTFEQILTSINLDDTSDDYLLGKNAIFIHLILGKSSSLEHSPPSSYSYSNNNKRSLSLDHHQRSLFGTQSLFDQEGGGNSFLVGSSATTLNSSVPSASQLSTPQHHHQVPGGQQQVPPSTAAPTTTATNAHHTPLSSHSNPAHQCKSFLDDDWLEDRVEHDQNMARVAGGLISRNGNPPKMAREVILHEILEHEYHHHHHQDEKEIEEGEDERFPDHYRPPVHHQRHHSMPSGGGRSLAFASVQPPGDYVCRLCGIAGHWLKDCALFEPRPSRSQSNGGNTPPANYVCRLCSIPGHWIEDCALFEHRNHQQQQGQASGPFNSASTNPLRPPRGRPPSNYVCNLCQQPGHWIQSCSLFKPITGGKAKPAPSITTTTATTTLSPSVPRTPQPPRDQHGHVIIRRPS